MSIKSVINKAMYSQQKMFVSIAEKVSDLMPKIGPGVGPKRDLIRLIKKSRKATDRQFERLLRAVAGRDPSLRAMLRK